MHIQLFQICVISAALDDLLVPQIEDNHPSKQFDEVFDEYTINIQLPTSWAETEVLSHTVRTTKTKDTSIKDKIYERLFDIEKKSFKHDEALKMLNLTIQDHRRILKMRRAASELKSAKSAEGNRKLDGMTIFINQLNNRMRSLEVKSATDPKEFMRELSMLYSEPISVLQRDVFELMQMMDKYDLKQNMNHEVRLRQVRTAINYEEEVKQLKGVVKVMQKRLDQFNPSANPDRNRQRRQQDSLSLSKLFENENDANIFRDMLDAKMGDLEFEIYSNLTNYRDDAIQYTEEMVSTLGLNLDERLRILEDKKETYIPEEVRSRIMSLEDGQSYLVQRIQDIRSLKDDIMREVDKNSEKNTSKPITFNETSNVFADTSAEQCQCSLPPEFGQAIIRLQMRTDVLKSDQKIFTDELEMRTEEIDAMKKEIKELQDEKLQIRKAFGEYQEHVGQLIDVTDSMTSKINYMEKQLKQQDKELKENTKITQYNHERLINAPFRCAMGGRKFRTHCFMLSKEVKSWPDAKSKCEKLGGSLAVIKDKETTKFVNNLIKSGRHDTSFWIGLHDRHDETNFMWVDGTPLIEYTNWYIHEPTINVDDEDCVHITGAIWNHQWTDRNCEHMFKYICQI